MGLDAETAAQCTVQFASPLFSDSGICYFAITPREGYAFSETYTVRVGTVTLSDTLNYSAKTNQWYFWCSSGITDYTIHVDGIVEDTTA